MRTDLVLCLIACFLTGCTYDGDGKTSHFEHDHEVAAHWPNDLADAAAKIRERLNASASDPEQSKQITKEIVDIVSWVPEIAADTNLSEQDWIPIDNAANSLSAKIRANDSEWTDEDRKQVVSFCELIDQSLDKIPSQLPSLRGSGT